MYQSYRIIGLLFCLCLFSGCLPKENYDLVITDVNIIEVESGEISQSMDLFINGNSISAIQEHDGQKQYTGTVINAAGKYLIPGLWDMHVHAASEDRIQSFSRLFLANGITGFRDMFGSLDVAEKTRASVEAGDLPGPPRITVPGHLIDGPPRSSQPGALIASSPNNGRRIVDSLDAAGAPFIKVYFGLPPETYFAIAEQARERGLPLVGHVPFLVRAAEASDAGHRSIEHLTGIVTGCSVDEEAVIEEWQKVLEMARVGDMRGVVKQYMVPTRLALATQDKEACRRLARRFIENDTWLVPTLVSLRGKAYLRQYAAKDDPRVRYFTPPDRWTGGHPFGFPMSEEQWDLLQEQYEREKDIIGMMAEVGVPLLAGSDTATPWAFPGFGLHEELELLVEAGLTPLQALRSATLNPARFFGRTNELGTVAENKLADLVLLKANPLEDIRNTQKILAVIADGRLYRQGDLVQLMSEVEASVKQTDKKE